MYLRFNPNKGFCLTDSPEDGLLKAVYDSLIDYQRNNPDPTQRKFAEIIMGETGVGRNRALSLIKRGEDNFWTFFMKKGDKNQRIYSPILREK
jgi:hypothetical protein